MNLSNYPESSKSSIELSTGSFSFSSIDGITSLISSSTVIVFDFFMVPFSSQLLTTFSLSGTGLDGPDTSA